MIKGPGAWPKKTLLRVASHEWAKPKPKLLKMDSITIPNKIEQIRRICFDNFNWRKPTASCLQTTSRLDVRVRMTHWCLERLSPIPQAVNNGAHLHWTSLDFAFWQWLKPIIWQNLLWTHSPTLWGGIMPSCRHSVIYLLGSGYQLSTVMLYWLHWNSYLRNILVYPQQGPKCFTVILVKMSEHEWSANHPTKLWKLADVVYENLLRFWCWNHLPQYDNPFSKIQHLIHTIFRWSIFPQFDEHLMTLRSETWQTTKTTSEHQFLHIFQHKTY